jgi:hypothetical protein
MPLEMELVFAEVAADAADVADAGVDVGDEGDDDTTVELTTLATGSWRLLGVLWVSFILLALPPSAKLERSPGRLPVVGECASVSATMVAPRSSSVSCSS